MNKNRFGQLFSLTTFGESHGPAVGGVIDGMPAGVALDIDRLQQYVLRRRPGQSSLSTQRNEADRVELLSGVLDGITLGTPIGFIVRNNDARSHDYAAIARGYRPNHADYTYEAKYGRRDARGGGRASARETVARVVAGAIAMQALETVGIRITAFTRQIGTVMLNKPYSDYDLHHIDNTEVRCPDATVAQQMAQAIVQARSRGDTLGGVVECVALGVPAGLGEPVFARLSAQLAAAMMSINAAKGVEIGDGFALAAMSGSEAVDPFAIGANRQIVTLANHSGGIQGGISNGMPIVVRVAFKPVATLMRTVETIGPDGEAVTLPAAGRHDPCVVPRAVPIVESMAAITLLDNLLINRAAQW